MSEQYTRIKIEVSGPVVRLVLARPEVRNAFDDVMIGEIDSFLQSLESSAARVLVITGEGDCFCAGADLGWMKRMKDYTLEENLADASRLAAMLRRLYELPLATVAAVNGHAVGGGVGLVAACDIAISVEEAKFAFSEVKLGLTPATISTYVIKRIGERGCRELFISGRRFQAREALAYGLLNQVVPREKFQKALGEVIDRIITSGPAAVKACKELLRKLPEMSLEEAVEYTSRMIADLRISDEAQEAMNAFFEKRPPRWIVSEEE